MFFGDHASYDLQKALFSRTNSARENKHFNSSQTGDENWVTDDWLSSEMLLQAYISTQQVLEAIPSHLESKNRLLGIRRMPCIGTTQESSCSNL